MLRYVYHKYPCIPKANAWIPGPHLCYIISMTTPNTAAEEILQILTDMNITYQIQEHKAIFSEKDSEDVEINLPGTEVKNLFVKDKHHNYGLVTMDLHKRADLKKIADLLGCQRLSFCNPDELMEFLAITPGSVTPLCIKADQNCKVRVLFDQNLLGKKVIVHPLRNTASISMDFSDLCRFVESYGHTWISGDVYKE